MEPENSNEEVIEDVEELEPNENNDIDTEVDEDQDNPDIDNIIDNELPYEHPPVLNDEETIAAENPGVANRTTTRTR